MFGKKTEKSGTSMDEVLRIFAFLRRDHGFGIYQKERQKSFGNFVVVLKGSFYIRFVNDRGDIFVDVKPIDETDDWFDLRNVFEYLEADKKTSYTNAGLQELASYLEENMDKVKAVLSENHRELKEKLKTF